MLKFIAGLTTKKSLYIIEAANNERDQILIIYLNNLMTFADVTHYNGVV